MAGASPATQAANQKALGDAVDGLSHVLGQIGVGGKLGLADVGVELRNLIVQKLSQPGAGRTYRRGNVFHRASAPGAPPAVDEGRYRASWTFQVGEDDAGPYVDVGTNEKTGPWLELGTRRMKARPHVRPAVAEFTSSITPTVAKAINIAQASGLGRLPKTFGNLGKDLFR